MTTQGDTRHPAMKMQKWKILNKKQYFKNANVGHAVSLTLRIWTLIPRTLVMVLAPYSKCKKNWWPSRSLFKNLGLTVPCLIQMEAQCHHWIASIWKLPVHVPDKTFPVWCERRWPREPGGVEITGQLWATDGKASGKGADLRSHWEEGSAGLYVHSWGPQNSQPSGRCVLLIPEPHVDDQLRQVFGPLVTSCLPWDLRVAQGRSPQTHLTSREESTGWH